MSKNMRSFLILTFVLMSFPLWARSVPPADTVSDTDIISAVTAAIRSGDAQTLASFFAVSVDLMVPGSEGTYSRSQAELIVKDFFKSNAPRAFAVRHQGSSGEGANFVIGLLETTSGNFRVYFLVKSSGAGAQLTQLQFEEE